MKKELRFALYSIKKNIQNGAELRVSFLMSIAGMAVNNTSLIVLWVFFVKSVGVINGWTAADIVGLQGFSALSYGVVFSVMNGIRKLPEYVSGGSFDRFMLSPKNVLVRVATSSFNASGLGDLIFGAGCLIIYAALIHAGIYQILLIFTGVIVASIVFLAVVIAVNSMSFLFADANSVTSSLFELFLTPALFHGGAFQGVLRFFFTFIIPSLLVGTLPVETVRDMSLQKLLLICVLALLWFFVSLRIFFKAVQKYESSSFMTFGS